ncbi:hypothetical protein [Streptomyces anulatus]|uniref:hypothetical protein n=1 Tax=Streptomyces anulatus TaxID=1892 RepID=UPI003F49CDB2
MSSTVPGCRLKNGLIINAPSLTSADTTSHSRPWTLRTPLLQPEPDFRDTGALKGKTKYSTTKNAEGQNRNLAELVGLYASDVGGLLIGKKDRKAQGVLGSYDLKYKITESKGSTLTVKYTASTDIDNESFLPSHAEWQKATNYGPKHMGGFFAGYRVEIRRQETVYK